MLKLGTYDTLIKGLGDFFISEEGFEHLFAEEDANHLNDLVFPYRVRRQPPLESE